MTNPKIHASTVAVIPQINAAGWSPDPLKYGITREAREISPSDKFQLGF